MDFAPVGIFDTFFLITRILTIKSRYLKNSILWKPECILTFIPIWDKEMVEILECMTGLKFQFASIFSNQEIFFM